MQPSGLSGQTACALRQFPGVRISVFWGGNQRLWVLSALCFLVAGQGSHCSWWNGHDDHVPEKTRGKVQTGSRSDFSPTQTGKRSSYRPHTKRQKEQLVINPTQTGKRGVTDPTQTGKRSSYKPHTNRQKRQLVINPTQTGKRGS